jgi:hypothetical protein
LKEKGPRHARPKSREETPKEGSKAVHQHRVACVRSMVQRTQLQDAKIAGVHIADATPAEIPGLLADAVAVARSVQLDVQMQVVAVIGVGARPEHGREPAAGCLPDRR